MTITLDNAGAPSKPPPKVPEEGAEGTCTREAELMANLPIEHTITLNNVSTGEVDFLNYAGTTLQDSFLSQVTGTVGWELVASAPAGEEGGGGWSLDWLDDPEAQDDAVGTLVFQNQSTGWVSLVAIDENFDVLGSHIVSYAGETDPAFLPRIEGEGFFGEGAVDSIGPQLVAQFEVDAFSSPFSGAIDLIGLDADGNIIQTQVVEGTTDGAIGWDLVGVASLTNDRGSAFYGPSGALTGENLDTGEFIGGDWDAIHSNPNLVLQLPDGTLDILAIDGNFSGGIEDPEGAWEGQTTFTSSLLLPQTTGLAPVTDVTPLDAVYFSSDSVLDNWPTSFGQMSATVHVVSQVEATGQVIESFLDSGWEFERDDLDVDFDVNGSGSSTGLLDGQIFDANYLGPNWVETPGADVAGALSEDLQFSFGTGGALNGEFLLL